MIKGNVDEIASLSGFTTNVATGVLASLQERRMVQYKTGMRILRARTTCVQPDPVPLCHSTRTGSSAALRSWGVPQGIAFTARKETNMAQIGYPHRHIARMFPIWLKSAMPQAEIWSCWSEVRIPGTSVVPDGLAWGRLDGHEVLFWLEVGDGHKSRAEITEVTARRLKQAQNLCARTGMRLVYVQLSPPWVHAAARWGCMNLSEDVAVVLGDWRQFGRLPMADWGRVAG